MRLIDAGECLRMIENSREDNPFFNGKTAPIWEAAHDSAISCVAACSTIDAVPVVRCKDCKHSSKYKAIFFPGHITCRLRVQPTVVKPDDFCSYGEQEGDQ